MNRKEMALKEIVGERISDELITVFVESGWSLAPKYNPEIEKYFKIAVVNGKILSRETQNRLINLGNNL